MTPLQKMVQKEPYKIVACQLALGIFISFIALIVKGEVAGFSVLAGTLSYISPNFLFITGVFRFARAKQMSHFVVAFFFGEGFKLILSTILVLMIVKYLPVSLLSVFVGFISAIMAFWLVCLWRFSREPTYAAMARSRRS